MSRPIILLSDFGLSDPFVGIMKAVIYRLAPRSTVIDLTHQIPPQDITRGALVLEDALPFLPDQAVVCAVVDPGVGGARRALTARSGQRHFVGPDNGLLSSALDLAPDGVFEVKEGGFVRPGDSRTFHGRDVFAPAAALLARGEPLESLGVPVRDWVRLEVPAPRMMGAEVLGLTIIAVDHFGNLTMNLARRDAELHWPWVVAGETRLLLRRGGELRGIHSTYTDVGAGEALAYWNSAARLEVAVNRGNASAIFGLRTGDTLILERDASGGR